MHFHDLLKKDLDALETEIEHIVPKEPKEVYGMLLPYIKRGGKRIRPILAFLCCRAVGGTSKKITGPVAIVELFHNFTLIHDDIEDNSEMRRGEPTLHKTYGIPIALNSGDAFYTCIWQAITCIRLKGKGRIVLAQLYADAFRRVVEGQGIELDWHRTNSFGMSEKDYIHMATGKTAALLGLSCELGAYLGGAGKKDRENLRSFGEYLGISFQIRDDILNISGNFEKYKKEIGGDISEGKRTLLVIHALKNASDTDSAIIKRILSSHSRKQEDIQNVISIFKSSGAIDYANKKAEEFKSRALDSICNLNENTEKSVLIELAEHILSREG